MVMTQGERGGKENGEKNSRTATDNQRKKNSENSAAGIGFMRLGQTNAIENDSPNHGDESATQRDHEQRPNGTAGETNDTKGGFKALLRAAYDHQANVKDSRGDKRADHDKDRRQDQKENPADAHRSEMSNRIIAIGENAERLKEHAVDKINNQPEAFADHRVDQRIGQAAFAFHGRERDGGTTQDHLQSFNERIEEWTTGAVLPRQTAPRRRCISHGPCGGSDCRSWHRRRRRRRRRGREFGPPRKRLPGVHSFFPTKIAGSEAPGAKSLAHFFF